MKVTRFWCILVVVAVAGLAPLAAQDADTQTTAAAQSQTANPGDAGTPDAIVNALSEKETLPIRRSTLYVVTLPIQKIGCFTKGFIVQYRKTATINKFAYLPLDWFEITDGKTPIKGEIVTLRKPGQWPQLQIYYNKDGSLSHVRVFVYGDIPTHPSWGMISSAQTFDSDFENIKNVKPELW
jgi:hypothetical protein